MLTISAPTSSSCFSQIQPFRRQTDGDWLERLGLVLCHEKKGRRLLRRGHEVSIVLEDSMHLLPEFILFERTGPLDRSEETQVLNYLAPLLINYVFVERASFRPLD